MFQNMLCKATLLLSVSMKYAINPNSPMLILSNTTIPSLPQLWRVVLRDHHHCLDKQRNRQRWAYNKALKQYTLNLHLAQTATSLSCLARSLHQSYQPQKLLNKKSLLAPNLQMVYQHTLKKLQSEGIISKERVPDNRKRFIYSPTKKCLDLVPIILEISVWVQNIIPTQRPLLLRW